MQKIKKASALVKKLLNREINYHLITPNNILLYLTFRCTSKCKSCVMWERDIADQELSLDQFKKFIDEAIHSGVRHVEMFGGDALLRKDILLPLIKYVKKHDKVSSDFTTNCNLLDQDTAGELAESGLDDIYVSLDGIGEVHDKIRGVPGSFERTRKGLEYLVKAKGSQKTPRIIINCTISALNIEHFEKIVSFGQDKCVNTIAFEYVGDFTQDVLFQSSITGIVPEPYYMSGGSTLRLNKKQAQKLKEKIASIKGNAPDGIKIETGNIDVLKIDNLVNGIFPRKKCYICRSRVTVDPYGNILPCPFFNKYSIGNIKDRPFAELWKNKRHRYFIERIEKRRPKICNYCIIGVERNPSFLQTLIKKYFVQAKKAYDQS